MIDCTCWAHNLFSRSSPLHRALQIKRTQGHCWSAAASIGGKAVWLWHLILLPEYQPHCCHSVVRQKWCGRDGYWRQECLINWTHHLWCTMLENPYYWKKLDLVDSSLHVRPNAACCHLLWTRLQRTSTQIDNAKDWWLKAGCRVAHENVRRIKPNVFLDWYPVPKIFLFLRNF